MVAWATSRSWRRLASSRPSPAGVAGRAAAVPDAARPRGLNAAAAPPARLPLLLPGLASTHHLVQDIFLASSRRDLHPLIALTDIHGRARSQWQGPARLKKGRRRGE